MAEPVSIMIRPDPVEIPIGVPAPTVVLSEEQRSLLRRTVEKVLHALHYVEVVVEVAPDGTVRFGGRLRQ